MAAFLLSPSPSALLLYLGVLFLLGCQQAQMSPVFIFSGFSEPTFSRNNYPLSSVFFFPSYQVLLAEF